MGWDDNQYPPYVPVAERRAQAAREVAKRKKRGETVSPVHIEGRNIATTFWGLAWCTNLESYSDFESRLPRGRTYARNGSVVDLQITKGRIKALVSGSDLYEIAVDIAPLPKAHWQELKERCAGQISSLVELLQGKLSTGVMEQVTNRDRGLFPKPKEIQMRCSCPDNAGMCKHLAAVLYGVGNRLDASPELLFVLRGVDHAELIELAIPAAPARLKRGTRTIASRDLGAIFDIEIDEPAVPKAATVASKPPPSEQAPKKTTAPRPAASAQKPKPRSRALKKKLPADEVPDRT